MKLSPSLVTSLNEASIGPPKKFIPEVTFAGDDPLLSLMVSDVGCDFTEKSGSGDRYASESPVGGAR